MLEREWERKPFSLLVGQHTNTGIIEILRRFLELPSSPAIPLMDIYAEDSTSYHRDTFTFMFLSALFTIAR